MLDNRKDLTKNKFLGNKLEIFQFSNGYRGNMDSVLVAASVTAESGQRVLELGSGNGVALCCLLYRISDLEVFGIEIDKRAADLCRQNIIFNKFKATILNSDLTTNIRELQSVSFDHVFMNPPYFKKTRLRSLPHQVQIKLKLKLYHCQNGFQLRRKDVNQKVKVTIIQRIERLPEIIKYLNGYFGQITVQPISSFKDTSPKTVIVQATKSSSGAFKLLAPKIVHKRDAVTGEVLYEDEFKKILSSGYPLRLN